MNENGKKQFSSMASAAEFSDFSANSSSTGLIAGYERRVLGAELLQAKDEMQSLVAEVENRKLIERQSDFRNPFGPIYLRDLQPDNLNKQNLIEIEKLSSQIEDRSHEIRFDDDWDD